MKEMWELCRKLGNAERLELLRLVYANKDGGLAVGDAVEASRLREPAVSIYMHQLLDLGLVRRERGGRTVAYYPDWSLATTPCAAIAKMLYERFSSGSEDTRFREAFQVFGNAFRLRIIRYVAQYEVCAKETLASVFSKSVRVLTRDLETAVAGGVLAFDQVNGSEAYRYMPPTDSIAWRVVNLKE